MKIFNWAYDITLAILLLLTGWQIIFTENMVSQPLYSGVLFQLFYYSFVLVVFIYLFVFALGSYLYLFTGGRRSTAAISSLAATHYLFVGLVLLLGILRAAFQPWFVLTQDPVWLSYSLLWAMFTVWFFIQKKIGCPRWRFFCSAIYGLLMVLHLPIILTAFSYHTELASAHHLAVTGYSLLTLILLFSGLLFLRIYRFFYHEIRFSRVKCGS